MKEIIAQELQRLADLNNDGKLDSADLLLAITYLLKFVMQFNKPKEENK